jgi:transposase
MWLTPPTVRIFLARAPADMRRSFDGLACLTREVLRGDPLSGHLFVFRNKLGDKVKIYYWDRTGQAIWYKKLERGTFRWPAGDGPSAEWNAADLALMLEGIDLASARRHKRFALIREDKNTENMSEG